MGRDVHPNLALDYRVLHIILSNIEQELLSGTISICKKRIKLLLGFYLLVRFTASLRRNEGLMMEVQGLLQYSAKGNYEPVDLRHIIMPLLEGFKWEQGEQWHLLLITEVTASGFKPWLWCNHVVSLLRRDDRWSGPCITDHCPMPLIRMLTPEPLISNIDGKQSRIVKAAACKEVTNTFFCSLGGRLPWSCAQDPLSRQGVEDSRG
eukprot:15348892-Ditylum_brightwellii.AAC.1